MILGNNLDPQAEDDVFGTKNIHPQIAGDLLKGRMHHKLTRFLVKSVDIRLNCISGVLISSQISYFSDLIIVVFE